MTEHILSISEAQREITQLPEQFEQGLEAATVTRYGKPVMTIVPAETYKELIAKIGELQDQIEGLIETMEILRDEETMAALRLSLQDVAEGRVRPWEEVKKELGLSNEESLVEQKGELYPEKR